MRRDMNIVRQIIKQVGDSEGKSFEGDFQFEQEVTQEELQYHIQIMLDAGIVDGNQRIYDDGDLIYYSLYLGWKGNDFYETFKDDNVWRKTKDLIKSKGMNIANMPTDILLELGKKYFLEL